MFTSNKAVEGGMEAGTEKYVVVSYHYYDTGSRGAYFDIKLDIDEKGVWTFHDPNFQTSGSNYTRFNTLYNGSADIKAYMDDFISWLTTKKFIVEREVYNDNSPFHLIPVDEPENYFKLVRVSFYGVAYLPVW